MKSFPEKKSLIKLRNGNRIGYAIYGNKRNFPIFYFHGWPGSRFELKNIPLKKKKCFIFPKNQKMLIWRSDLEELEYPEHAKNLINRKITIFYIEAIPQKISQLRKKIFFFETKKNIVFCKSQKTSLYGTNQSSADYFELDKSDGTYP